jgi:DNA polymerase III subunit delta
VCDAKDTIVTAVRMHLSSAADSAAAGGLVVIEAGELASRSPLRQLIETSPVAVALACYADDGKTLAEIVHAELAAARITADPVAMDLLLALLGSDRAVSRSELQKLALYKGEPGRITVEDVLAIVGDAGATSLEAVAYAACDVDPKRLDRAIVTASAEGAQAVSLLRATARLVQRVVQARESLADGLSVKQAMEALKPPVIFRMQAVFASAVRRWDRSRLAQALVLLADAELACKRTGAPQMLLCQRALLDIAEIARSPAAASAPWLRHFRIK